MTIASTRTLCILAAAVGLSGLLAGADFDRALIAMPAWQHIRPSTWAEFSQHADLGNGVFLYPAQAIGSFLLLVATLISLRLDGAAPDARTLPLYAALVLSVAGLLLTFKAAPVMLGVEKTSDPLALGRAFDSFRFWGNLRAVCQILAFAASIWSLVWLRAPTRSA